MQKHCLLSFVLHAMFSGIGNEGMFIVQQHQQDKINKKRIF